LGLKYGILVYALDFLKSFLPLMLIKHEIAITELDLVIFGVASVLGHNYTPFLKFKGGKGIATSCGVLLAIMPYAFLVVAGVWGVLFAICRTVSIASLVASIVLPISVYFLYPGSTVLLVFALILCGLSFWRHRSNIQRLLSGEELVFKKK
jgi:glycerol-3-phosphate acyltransferase PlsY